MTNSWFRPPVHHKSVTDYRDWLQLGCGQPPIHKLPGDDLIRDLMDEEREVSYRRRILHGKIDILRAELQARLKKDVGEGKSPLHDIDVDKLAEILATKASPPAE